MPGWEINKPVETQEPFVSVDNPNLPVGRYVFQLIVTDDEGNQSDPAKAVLVVSQPPAPPGPLRPIP